MSLKVSCYLLQKSLGTLIQLMVRNVAILKFYFLLNLHIKYIYDFVKPDEVNKRYAICIEEVKARKIARRPTAIAP